MNCLVTGATGFVGSHLCESLEKENHHVYALTRPSSLSRLPDQHNYRVIEGDLDSKNKFAHYAEELDVVFHLAAVTKAIKDQDFYSINVDGTLSLLEGLRRGGFRGRFVLLSSLAASGPSEPSTHLRIETDKSRPVSSYGKSKLRAEKAVKSKLPPNCTYTILRPGAIYGPREHEIYEILKVMNKLGLAINFGQGTSTQMTHVEDVVNALLLSAFNQKAAGKTYFVNDEDVWSFTKIVALLEEQLNRRIRIIPLPYWSASALATLYDFAGYIFRKPLSPLNRDKVNELRESLWAADSSLIRRELLWKPAYQLPEGLEETMKWYRANQWL